MIVYTYGFSPHGPFLLFSLDTTIILFFLILQMAGRERKGKGRGRNGPPPQVKFRSERVFDLSINYECMYARQRLEREGLEELKKKEGVGTTELHIFNKACQMK